MSMYGYRNRRRPVKKSARVVSETTAASLLRQFHVVDPKTIFDLFKKSPDSFNFRAISASQISKLLYHDFELFAPHLDVDSISVNEKVFWLGKTDTAFKYIDVHKLPNYAVDGMVAKTPALADRAPIPLSKIAFSGWHSLVNHDRAYLFKLVDNLPAMRNKTELRRLIVANPDIFPILTIDAMKESVITAKEWALLLKWPGLKNKTVKYSPDVTEWLDQEILTEILLGNSKASKQLNTALAILRS